MSTLPACMQLKQLQAVSTAYDVEHDCLGLMRHRLSGLLPLYCGAAMPQGSLERATCLSSQLPTIFTQIQLLDVFRQCLSATAPDYAKVTGM